MLAVVLMLLAANDAQQKIDDALPGDVVELEAGEVAGPLRIDKAITLRGAGIGKTTVRGTTVREMEAVNAIIVSAKEGEVRIERLSVVGGRGIDGGGIAHRSATSLILEDVEISRGSAPGGGGLDVAFAKTVTLRRVLIHHNSAVSGSGASIEADTIVLEDSTFERNRGGYALIAISDRTLLKNISFLRNIDADQQPRHGLFWCRRTRGCSLELDGLTSDSWAPGSMNFDANPPLKPKVTVKNMIWPLGQ
jgi:hypothetical protein